MRWLLIACAITASLFILSFPLQKAFSEELPQYTEGKPQKVRAVICDDAEKALSLLETWRKEGNVAANAELRKYMLMRNKYGHRVCGSYYGAIMPLKRFATVEGLVMPAEPDKKMDWHVIAIRYGHLFSEVGFMLSRFGIKPKSSSVKPMGLQI